LAGWLAFGISNAHAEVFGEIGTTGAGLHVAVPLASDFGVRLGMGQQLGYSYKGGTRDLDFDFRLKGKTYDALLDWYPSKDGTFRVTAGVAYNGNSIAGSARANSAGSYAIQGNTYNAASAGSIDSRIDFKKMAPYLGIGWGRSVEKDKGWSFSSDIGVMFQGSPRTSLTSSGCTAGAAVCNQLASDIGRENAALSQEANKLKLYPVLRIGVSYKF
jgi:hypothetical protein